MDSKRVEALEAVLGSMLEQVQGGDYIAFGM